jgi:intracellular septation protein
LAGFIGCDSSLSNHYNGVRYATPANTSSSFNNMKLLFDFFPIILFFLGYYQAEPLIQHTFVGALLQADLQKHVAAAIVATGIALVANAAQVAWTLLRHRRVQKMHLFSFAIFLVMGTTTIILADPDFLKWKPTVINWLFAVAFFASFFIGERNLVERMMSSSIELPDAVWTRLNIAWIVFFLVSGAANLYVAFFYGLDLDAETRMDTWVNFKLFGLIGLTLIFIILQALYLARHIVEEDDDADTGTGGKS